MFAIPLLFACSALFAVAVIVEAGLRHGPRALALRAELDGCPATCEVRYRIAELGRVAPADNVVSLPVKRQTGRVEIPGGLRAAA